MVFNRGKIGDGENSTSKKIKETMKHIQYEKNIKLGYEGKKPELLEFSETILVNKYKEVGDFQNKFAPVMDSEGFFGFIDREGHEIAPCIYFDYRDFSDGLAAVKDKNTKLWGYINEQGKIVIPYQYKNATSFNNGVARVMNDNYYSGFIDKEGNEIVLCEYYDGNGNDAIETSYDTKCSIVTIKKDDKYGYFNKITKSLIPCTYKNVRDFNEGYGAVKDDKGLWGYINEEGKKVIECQYLDAKDFHEGMAVVQDKDTKLWGYINKKGKKVIECQYLDAKDFHEGMAVVQDEKTKEWKYISIVDERMGMEYNYDIFHNHDSIHNFDYRYPNEYEILNQSNNSNGLIKARYRGKVVGTKEKHVYVGTKNNKPEYSKFERKYYEFDFGHYGYMDKKGKEKTPFKYRQLEDFVEDMSPAMDENNRWGFIDNNGQEVIPCQFLEVRDFHEGLAAVMDENEVWHFIDKCGNKVITLDQTLYYSGLMINEIISPDEEKVIIVYADSEERLLEEKRNILETIKEKIKEEEKRKLKEIKKQFQMIDNSIEDKSKPKKLIRVNDYINQ